MVIYVDVLLIVNFTVSYFLFLTSAVMSGYTYKRKNILAASFSGALFCLYIFVQTDSLLIDSIVKIFSLAVCAVIAFGYKNRKKLFVQTVYYVVLNALFTGIVFFISFRSPFVYHNNMFFYLEINPVLLVIVAFGIYCLLVVSEIIKEKLSPRGNYSMDVFFKDFCLKNISAFYDSGFNVKDIVSNKDVIIISTVKIKQQLPEQLLENVRNFTEEKYHKVNCTFVPIMFTTLSGNGILPALKADCVMVENKRIENIVTAFTTNTLAENVDAIFGTDIKRQL